MRELGSRQICGRVPTGQPVSFRSLRLLTVGCADEEVEDGSVVIKMSLCQKNYRLEGAKPVITDTGEAPDHVYVNLPLYVLTSRSDFQLILPQILPHFSSCRETRKKVGHELLFFGLDMGRVAVIIGYKKLIITVEVEELVLQNIADGRQRIPPLLLPAASEAATVVAEELVQQNTADGRPWFPSFLLPAASEAAVEAKEEICAICQDQLAGTSEEDDIDLMDLPCSHIFHRDCLFKWWEESPVCPVCRLSISVIPLRL